MLSSHLTYLIEAQEPADLRRLAEHLPYGWMERAVHATGAASIRRRRLPVEQVVWDCGAIRMHRSGTLKLLMSTGQWVS
jgi:hypothetical protein